MKEVILVRYGEIILKGLNRPVFEDKLMSNIKKSLNGLGKISVKRSQARIFIEPENEGYDFAEAVSRLTRVFGIVSVSKVRKIESDFEEIKKNSLEMVREYIGRLSKKSVSPVSGMVPADLTGSVGFKVEANRGD